MNRPENPLAGPEMGRAPSGDRALRRILLLLFFLSGACGLVYEVVWMRMLTLVFGATAFATGTILASFFTGLALGSFHFGRMVDRGKNPLRLYALLEAGIGVSAFLVPAVFAGLDEVYVAVYRRFSPGFELMSFLRAVLSFTALLVPATLLGGTLPVITKFFVRRREALGREVGRLYAANTFGAVAGAFGAGFLLILLLGGREAAYAAGAVNLLVAGAVLVLDRRWRGREATPPAKPAAGASGAPARGASERPAAKPSPKAARVALWAVGIAGFSALALEVFWTRALVFYLDNSVHAFTTILTAFLLGIAGGSLLIGRLVHARRRLLAWFGTVEVLVGVTAILTIPVLDALSPTVERLATSVASVGPLFHWKWIGMRFATTLSVMLVPTVLMGMTLPLAAAIRARHLGTVGTDLGDVYAANTLGGVMGSAGAGFALVPLVGVRDGILLVAVLSVVVGAGLLLFEPRMRRWVRTVAVGGPAMLLLGAGAIRVGEDAMVLTSAEERGGQREVLSYRQGVGATVKVYRDRHGEKVLSIDGFPVAGTSLSLQETQKVLAHLPLLLTDVDAPRVGIVGFGAGGTAWGTLRYDVERVDVVELVPAVVEAATWFPEVNHGVLDEPRLNLIRGDGRNYLRLTDRTYDVISVDATSPKMAGNGSLYTLEFYELMEDRLSPDGLVVQWIPIHLLSDAEVRMVAATFTAAFPHASLWFTPLRQYVILVGGERSLAIDPARLRGRMAMGEARRELAEFHVDGPVDVLSWFVMGEEALADYAEGSRLNTDDHPYLEFTPPLAYFVSDMYLLSNLVNLGEARESVLPYLTGAGAAQEAGEPEPGAAQEAGTDLVRRLRRRFEAREYSIRGDVLLLMGERRKAGAAYVKALQVDPTERNWLNARYAGEVGRRKVERPPP